MANELTAENINVAEFMEREEMTVAMHKMEEVVDADPEASALLEKAESIEDVYHFMKHFAQVTMEQVKVIFKKTVDYFKETKAELADDVLDHVSGGWGFPSSWGAWKKDILMAATILGCAVLCAAIGAATFGVGGAIAGVVIGVATGVIVNQGTDKAKI